MRKIFLISIVIFLSLGTIIPFFKVEAQENVRIDVFYSQSCPHCKEARYFLNQLEQEYPASELVVNHYDLAEESSIELIKDFYQRYNVPVDRYGLVPAIFVADQYTIGFSEQVGQKMKNYISGLVAQCREIDHQDCDHNQVSSDPEKLEAEREFKLPIIGSIDISGLSPFVLSMTVGALDGFNACAMTALGFLLAVLVATGIRKRIFLIGGVFILVSGLVYFLFISAWLELFMFVGYQKYFQLIVSVVVIIFALVVLKDYYTGVICKVCNVDPNKQDFFSKLQRKLFVKMSNLSKAEMSLGATLIGVGIVAAGVNLIELACSFGLPVAYTSILTSYNLSSFQYYSYLLVYIFFYMLDDFLIFLVAVVTLKITKVSDKYLKVVKLISGLVLLIIGFSMLLRVLIK